MPLSRVLFTVRAWIKVMFEKFWEYAYNKISDQFWKSFKNSVKISSIFSRTNRKFAEIRRKTNILLNVEILKIIKKILIIVLPKIYERKNCFDQNVLTKFFVKTLENDIRIFKNILKLLRKFADN